jgi:hypothetical protein
MRKVWLLKPTAPSAGAGAAAHVPTQCALLAMTVLRNCVVERIAPLQREARLLPAAITVAHAGAAFKSLEPLPQ